MMERTHVWRTDSGHRGGSVTTKVLGDCCECELELGTSRSTQSQTTKPQDTLEMGKQHLDTLSIVLLKRFGLSECPSYVPFRIGTDLNESERAVSTIEAVLLLQQSLRSISSARPCCTPTMRSGRPLQWPFGPVTKVCH
jgi:hypothetical protein